MKRAIAAKDRELAIFLWATAATLMLTGILAACPTAFSRQPVVVQEGELSYMSRSKVSKAPLRLRRVLTRTRAS